MTPRTIKTMKDLQICIVAMYNKINETFFNNELEKVVITFEDGYKKGAFGWICNQKEWKQGKAERYNINLSADYLNRSKEEIISTLIHEMCHLYAIQNDIKDTSRAGIYHNKKFKEIAEAHGLNVKEADKIGYSVTSLNDNTKEWLKENCNFDNISIYKKKPLVAEKIAKPKQSSRKYVCPCCGLIVRATKECKIKCIECNKDMKYRI